MRISLPWTVLWVCSLVLVGAASGRISYDAGFGVGYAASESGHDEVKATMRKIGFCAWPAAFYRDADCPGTMTYTPDP